MRSLVSSRNGTFHDLDPSAIGAELREPNALVWLDITDPDQQDLELLRAGFGFHPLSIEDILHEQQRPKIDAYDGYYFLVLYAATFDQASERVLTQPLYLFIGQNFVVTIHRGLVREVEETLRRWQRPHNPIGHRVAALIYHLIDAIVDDYFPVIDALADKIDEIEDAIFSHFEEETIQAIFSLKRDLLTFRRVIAPERDVVNVLLRREVPVFQNEDMVYLQDVYDHIVRVIDSLDIYRDLLSSALDSYLSLQSNKLNQVVKVLTITSIVLMSDALIAGIYGMNFQHMPELGWTFGYPFALGLMVSVSLGLVLTFRRLKWI